MKITQKYQLNAFGLSGFTGQDLSDTLFDDGHALFQKLGLDCQGRQEFEHLVLCTRSLDNETVFKTLLGNLTGELRLLCGHQTLNQSATAHAQTCICIALNNVLQTIANDRLFFLDFLRKLVILPIVFKRLGSSYKGQVVSSECAAMRSEERRVGEGGRCRWAEGV